MWPEVHVRCCQVYVGHMAEYDFDVIYTGNLPLVRENY